MSPPHTHHCLPNTPLPPCGTTNNLQIPRKPNISCFCLCSLFHRPFHPSAPLPQPYFRGLLLICSQRTVRSPEALAFAITSNFRPVQLSLNWTRLPFPPSPKRPLQFPCGQTSSDTQRNTTKHSPFSHPIARVLVFHRSIIRPAPAPRWIASIHSRS